MTCSIIQEVISLQVPFASYSLEAGVITAVVVRRERPNRPNDKYLSADLWELMERCWCDKVDLRCRMAEVVGSLNSLVCLI